MTQNTRNVVGVLFLVLSVAAISLFRINPNTTTPARSTQTRTAGIMERVVQGVVITQEFNVIREYLCGIDFIFTHGGRNNTNENTLLLLDADFKKLYQAKFSSKVVKEGDWTSILFDKAIYVGKGSRVHVCLFSDDGTTGDAVSPLFNQTDSIGPLYVSQVTNGNVIGSLPNKVRQYPGSLILKTYGSDSSQFWLMKGFLYLLALIIACNIIWYKWARTTLARIRILPEWIFLAIALPVSVVFSFITPPLQVPDEGSHFYKSYDVAEFNLFTKVKTTPVSILNLDSAFMNLHMAAGDKTGYAEIVKHFNDRLEPHKRAVSNPPPYVLPYLPQAIGILFGKISGASPLMMMYLGRLFNLLVSILIMFYAIRIIPQFKWIFFLLALMPKTLFLFGSLSYDSLTISLSFMAIAVFLHYAYACERNLNIKDLALMAGLVLLLLLCKPPYFLIGLLFFFIPPKKFGQLYRYIIISIGVVVVGLVLWKGLPAAESYFSEAGKPQQEVVAGPPAAGNNLPVIRPEEQIQIIMNDIPAYMKLIFKSGFDLTRDYILESFVGLLGWIDVEFPDLLTYSYLLLILMTALVLADQRIPFGYSKKTILLLILFVSFVIIETAMYVYATRPGRDQVFGVQGRYFIPVAPLFFMLFYNRYINPKLNLLLSMRRKEYHNTKVKGKPAIFQEITEKEQLFDKTLYLFLTCFTLFTSLYSIYITLIRYYNI